MPELPASVACQHTANLFPSLANWPFHQTEALRTVSEALRTVSEGVTAAVFGVAWHAVTSTCTAYDWNVRQEQDGEGAEGVGPLVVHLKSQDVLFLLIRLFRHAAHSGRGES